MKINAVDLFCGVGGLTKGLLDSGINVVAGIDIEKKCRFPYEENNHVPFFNKDIRSISYEFVNDLYPDDTDVKMLVGCAPCQPFSTYSQKYKKNNSINDKIDLLDYFGKIIEGVKPDIIAMENVPQLAKYPVFKKFINLLSQNGYQSNWKIVYAPEYGVPQNRKRLILLASNKKYKISLPKPSFTKEHYPSVRQAISMLSPLQAGEVDSKDPMHTAVNLTPVNLERIRHSKPGGSWKDWPKSLILEAHKRDSGNSYTSVYGRMSWDKPAPTITTKYYGYGNGRFGHPQQNRALSYREGALLQTFPQNYIFFDDSHPISKKDLGIMVGNAVPVKLAFAIGKAILRSIQNDN